MFKACLNYFTEPTLTYSCEKINLSCKISYISLALSALVNDKYTEPNQFLVWLCTQPASELPWERTQFICFFSARYLFARWFSVPSWAKKLKEWLFAYEKQRLIFINKIFHFNKGKVPAGCLHLIKIQRQEVWGFKLPRLNFLLTDSCTNWKSPVTDQLCCWPRNYVCMYFIFVKFTLNVLMKSVIWKPRFTQCLQLEGTSGCHLVQAGSGSTSDLT